MSKISTVYAKLTDKTGKLFLTKQRLHNPYNLTENPDGIRRNGWGLAVNSANNETQDFCDLSLSRSFNLVLTRQFVSLAGKEDGFDSVSIELLEAQQSFLAMIYNPDELGITESIDRIDINEVSGIEFETTDEKKFLNCNITFTITISERL